MKRMGFDKTAGTAKRATTGDILAKQLLRTLNSIKVVRGYNSKTWSHYLQLLLRDHDQETIEAVITWYGEHHGQPYVPHITSAKALRAKFDSLVQAMNRSGSRYLGTPVTPRAELIAKELRRLPWPENAVALLTIAVQVSMDHYSTFTKSLRDFVAEWEPKQYTTLTPSQAALARAVLMEEQDIDPEVAYPMPYRTMRPDKGVQFAKYVLGLYGNVTTFVEFWFRERVHYAVTHHEQPIMELVFTTSHIRFRHLLDIWAMEWGTASAAKDLLKRIYPNEDK